MDILPCPGDPAPFASLALQQHPHYLRTVQRMGRSGQALVVRHHGQIIARVQVIRRQIGPVHVNWIGRGPVWSSEIDQSLKTQALRALNRHLPGAALTLALPDSPRDLSVYRPLRFRPVMTPHYLAELDLEAREADRLAAQHCKWRNRLRHSQSQNLTVTDGPFQPERDTDLLAREAIQRKSRGYRALPLSFVGQWAHANPKHTRVFRASGAGGLQAFMVVLLHHPGATYHIGWSNSAGRANSAHNLLFWRASNWLAQRRYKRFDLGVVDTENAPGLARFKLGAGATSRSLGPTLLHFAQPRLFRHKSRVA